jgi:hypothetical protein
MKNFLSPFSLAFLLSLALVSSASATPVTAKDLSGKTICYNTGERATYFPGGKYENNQIGNGTWAVTAHGVQLHTERFSGLLDFEKQPDGTITIDAYHLIGKYCK